MSLEPDYAAFAKAYAAGRPQLVWTRLIDDLETPVSAYLKIGHGRPYAFLFESVEGGAYRGRYSIVAMKPELVWRCRGDASEIAHGADIEAGRFTPQAGGALDNLRDLVAATRLDLPKGLPPMATGLFGALGYDMIRLAETLRGINPDPLDLPDAVMIRPSLVAIFDAIGQEIILVTRAEPRAGVDAKQAHAEALARLDETIADLRKPLAGRATHEPAPAPQFVSPVERGAYHGIVEAAKEYIRAGDIFQVVPSHRFRAKVGGDPFAVYRSLRRTNPSPFLFFLNFGAFQLVGSSPEILVRLRDGKITIRPIAGTRPRGKTPEQDLEMEKELLADPKERAEHLMLLDLGRNDVGRVAMLRQDGRNTAASAPQGPNVRVTESFTIERYSHVMHIVSNVEGEGARRRRSGRCADGRPASRHLVRRAEGPGDADHRRAGNREARRGLRRRGRLFRRRRLGRHLHRPAHRAVQGRDDVRPGRRRGGRRFRSGFRVRRDRAQVDGPAPRGRGGLAFRLI